MENTVILTANEIFQLAAVGPCLFVIFYLFFATSHKYFVIIPILYFISITCTLLLPVLSIFPELDSETNRRILLFNEHMAPELAFLLILQFLLQRPPPLIYWSILAVPFIGGGPLFYLSLSNEDACLLQNACIPSEDLMAVYRAISTGLIFLLLIPILNKKSKAKRRGKDWTHQYWLIVVLTLYNVMIMGLDLFKLSGEIGVDEADFIHTMFSVAFIYLVLSSIFRVFNKSLKIHSINEMIFSPREQDIISDIEKILQNDKPYRDLNFNRGVLADSLRLTEQYLSKIINSHYKRSFSELMNDYRVLDAKDLLHNTDKSVTEISFDAGFKSITSFNRVFKEFAGMSPSKFRESKSKS